MLTITSWRYGDCPYIILGRFRGMGAQMTRVYNQSLGSPCRSSVCSRAAPETGCHLTSLPFFVVSDHLAAAASLPVVLNTAAVTACRRDECYVCLSLRWVLSMLARVMAAVHAASPSSLSLLSLLAVTFTHSACRHCYCHCLPLGWPCYTLFLRYGDCHRSPLW